MNKQVMPSITNAEDVRVYLETLIVKRTENIPPQHFAAQFTAASLLKIDKWPKGIEFDKRIISRLLSYDASVLSKLEIILRMQKLGNKEQRDILVELANIGVADYFQEPCAKMAFVCLLKIVQPNFNLSNDEIYKNLEIDRFDYDHAIKYFRNLGNNLFSQSKTSQLFQSAYFTEYVKIMGSHIHKLKAKDSTGRWAYYFVMVEPAVTADFMISIDGTGTIDLEDYGKVIASCYGEEPTPEIKDYLMERYGFEL
jgi:hypothetical protein